MTLMNERCNRVKSSLELSDYWLSDDRFFLSALLPSFVIHSFIYPSLDYPPSRLCFHLREDSFLSAEFSTSTTRSFRSFLFVFHTSDVISVVQLTENQKNTILISVSSKYDGYDRLVLLSKYSSQLVSGLCLDGSYKIVERLGRK